MPVGYKNIVKFFRDEDGCNKEDSSWHCVTTTGGDPAKLCSGEHFGYGISAVSNEYGLDYEEKIGRVTCESCRELIKQIKEIKL